ncbi:hypothetical protein GN958_ATG19321, partial [Phytophthora infestans]
KYPCETLEHPKTENVKRFMESRLERQRPHLCKAAPTSRIPILAVHTALQGYCSICSKMLIYLNKLKQWYLLAKQKKGVNKRGPAVDSHKEALQNTDCPAGPPQRSSQQREKSIEMGG